MTASTLGNRRVFRGGGGSGNAAVLPVENQFEKKNERWRTSLGSNQRECRKLKGERLYIRRNAAQGETSSGKRIGPRDNSSTLWRGKKADMDQKINTEDSIHEEDRRPKTSVPVGKKTIRGRLHLGRVRKDAHN